MKLKWKFKSNGAINSSPVIKNGIIYFGSHDSYFYGLEIESGEKLFSFKTKNPINFSSIVSEQIIYFSDVTRLYALDLKNYKENWIFWKGEIYSSPFVYKTIIFICVDHKIIALDKKVVK